MTGRLGVSLCLVFLSWDPGLQLFANLGFIFQSMVSTVASGAGSYSFSMGACVECGGGQNWVDLAFTKGGTEGQGAEPPA